MSVWDIANSWYAAPLLEEQWIWFNTRFLTPAGHLGWKGWTFG